MGGEMGPPGNGIGSCAGAAGIGDGVGIVRDSCL